MKAKNLQVGKLSTKSEEYKIGDNIYYYEVGGRRNHEFYRMKNGEIDLKIWNTDSILQQFDEFIQEDLKILGYKPE